MTWVGSCVPFTRLYRSWGCRSLPGDIGPHAPGSLQSQELCHALLSTPVGCVYNSRHPSMGEPIMSEERPSLGEQELEVWRWIAGREPVSAREAIDHFAGERDLARTTVLTVIERLWQKGY